MKAYIADTNGDGSYYTLQFNGYDIIGKLKRGSFNIVAARLFGLTYPNYLRYVRDNYNGEIIGRNGYSYIGFKNKKDCEKLAIDLNKIWDKILSERQKNGLSNGGT